MPRDKDRRRVIRTRMAKTGESYTAARAHVLSKPRSEPPAAPRVDHAALAGTSDASIATRTGRTWQEWVRALDADDAASLPHRDIARIVRDKHGVGSWWAQTVTVGYERIKGLRERGQRRSGAYEAGRSRTFGVPVKTLFHAWADAATRRRWMGDVTAVVRTATAPKSIRLQWPDGTIVVAGFMATGDSKSAVAVVHTKLRDKAAAAEAKAYWTGRFDALGSLLGTGRP